MAEEQLSIFVPPIFLKDMGFMYPCENSSKKVRYGMFKCFCGAEFKARIYSVMVLKETKSCGCYRKTLKEYLSKNIIDRKKVYSKRYRDNNKEKISKQNKIYKKTNFAIIASKNYKHKRRSLAKQGDVTTKQMMELQKNAKKCYWCGCSLKNVKVHIDHYVPLSKGGQHSLSNLVVSCSSCNLAKQARDPLVFANSIGKLL